MRELSDIGGIHLEGNTQPFLEEVVQWCESRYVGEVGEIVCASWECNSYKFL